MPNIVVVGAGVSGLTTAKELSQNPNYKVTIVAKHMPGDYDIEYASPWAGANYLPVSDAENNRWEKGTWAELARLAKDVPEAGIHFQTAEILNREKDVNSATGQGFKHLFSAEPWYKDVVPDFKTIPKEKLPSGFDSGTTFTSVCINTAIYLPYLVGQCLKNGAVVKRAVLDHISDAASLHHLGKADVIVNCTGLLAAKLGGVMDKEVIPARGQIVLVRNDPGVMLTISGTDDGDDEFCYTMKRAAGGGTVLGGTYMKGSWESQPDPNQAIRIMKRAVEMCPALTNGSKKIEDLSVIRHGVGLRPLRLSGVRVEKEKIDNTWVVHNYGHGGWGYQSSYGCTKGVIELVEDVLAGKSKL
ncbi:FAD dependent oxidoreductase [Phlyctema vagabunda]|uniref:FAD dependent oxidoreductase n=1 Tax=Phlyctema vagabunda TaxID=108571 RepID=A0ABR4PVK0_9HELO